MESNMVKEKYNHWLPPLLGVDAVTLYDTIYYRKSQSGVGPTLRRHEMAHIEQFRQLGLVGFLLIYIKEYIQGRLNGLDHWGAYYNISLEKEAYEKQKKVR